VLVLESILLKFGLENSFATQSPKSGHSANARVYEYTAYGAAENKSLEIKRLRPRRAPRC
jgi:hypothetical protein